MEARHTARLRSRPNKCFSHTPTSSLNIQFGPSTGIISGSLVWAAPVHKQTLVCLEVGKLYIRKENACSGGSCRVFNELPHRRSFSPVPGIKVNKEGPGKAQQSGMGKPLNLIPRVQNKEPVRIQRQHGFLRGGSESQLMEPPQRGWKTLQQRKNELLEILEKKCYFLKGWEMWPARPPCFQSRPGELERCTPSAPCSLTLPAPLVSPGAPGAQRFLLGPTLPHFQE